MSKFNFSNDQKTSLVFVALSLFLILSVDWLEDLVERTWRSSTADSIFMWVWMITPPILVAIVMILLSQDKESHTSRIMRRIFMGIFILEILYMGAGYIVWSNFNLL